MLVMQGRPSEMSGYRYQVSALNPKSTQEGTDQTIR